jgi:predicted amidohydrolase
MDKGHRGLRVGLAQINVVEGDTSLNLATAAAAVAAAAGEGADLVVLPEMVLTGFLPRDTLHPLAQDPDGPAVRSFRTMAIDNRVAVVAGYPERGASDGVVYNTSSVFGRSGELLTSYHKTHLWDLEGLAITPGEALDSLFTFAGVRFGVLCCFDIEFPEPARALALGGAQCLLVPSGNMMPWDHHHRVYIQARALENHVFVAYTNRAGSSPRYQFPGESALVDPTGRLVAQVGNEPAVVCADVDLRLIEESRRVFDYLRARRPGLYRGA